MNVLIIPEDFRNDQYILQPLVSSMYAALGKPRAKVKVCRDPLLGGVTEALNHDRLAEVFERYDGMTDVYMLCVDRDGVNGRRDALRAIEEKFGGERALLTVAAQEELETWALAGVETPAEWRWREVRADVSVKERYFEPLATSMGVKDGPGGGRMAIGQAAARSLDAIRQKCPEDFGALFDGAQQLLR